MYMYIYANMFSKIYSEIGTYWLLCGYHCISKCIIIAVWVQIEDLKIWRKVMQTFNDGDLFVVCDDPFKFSRQKCFSTAEYNSFNSKFSTKTFHFLCLAKVRRNICDILQITSQFLLQRPPFSSCVLRARTRVSPLGFHLLNAWAILWKATFEFLRHEKAFILAWSSLAVQRQ